VGTADDEAAIRQFVATWMAASKVGDVETVLCLIADDAVFLIPGRDPMRKDEFAAASRSQSGPAPQFEGRSEIREIQVLGDWAFKNKKRGSIRTSQILYFSAPMPAAGNLLGPSTNGWHSEIRHAT
jgi:uncharacterized protein (TIGR02246 family)